MSQPGSNDAHVQGTNDDAQLSKMSCVKLGYFNDDFIGHFVKHPVRRAPLINRGYYSRYAALRGLLLRFLELQPAPWDAGQQAQAQLEQYQQQQQGQQQQQQQPSVAGPQGTEVGPAPPPRPPALQQVQQQQQQQPADKPLRQNGQQQAQQGGLPKQVVSVGAGFDTTYFQLAKEGRAPERYIELDFREVTSRKAAIIQQTPDLLSWLGPPEACTIDVEGGCVLGPRYALLPVDLRDLQSLEAALCGSSNQHCGSRVASNAAGSSAAGAEQAAAAAAGGAAAEAAAGDCGCGGSPEAGPDGAAACAAAAGAAPAAMRPVLDPQLPTFVLSECVLVYMEPRESAEVVRWLGQRLHCAAMAIYEQIRPHDAFGRQMLLNLECRGCPLKGIQGTPDLEAQRRRLLQGGWHRAEARSMDEVYRNCLELGDRRRIERLELFDEFEEWDLIQAHYCISLGVKDSSGLLEGFGFREYRPQLPAALLAQRRPIG